MVEVELVSWTEALERLSSVVRERAKRSKPLRVVEAGCGRQWGLDVDPETCFITGIDSDSKALEARVRDHGDLHRSIVGDVQDRAAFELASADLVYSAYVLEHLARAEEAASAWADWLAPGGTLILIAPDAKSVWGWVAKNTPYAFHVWAYRALLGRPDAGKPGHAPYPVHYSPMLTVDGLMHFARSEGLEIEAIYAIGDMQRNVTARDKIQNHLFAAIKRLVNVVSIDRLSWRHDNLAVVMSRPAESSRATI